MELGLHQARSLGDPLIVRSALALIRRLIPERWRARLHPFPSLRQSVLYADVWDEIPGGPVLVWTRDPAGALIGCGGTLARWAAAGVPIDLIDVRPDSNDDRTDCDSGAFRKATAMLGIATLRRLDSAQALDDARRIRPEVLLVPGPLDAGADLLKLLAGAVSSLESRWIALYEGADSELANVVVELDAEELARRRSALAEVSAELALAADGLAEYRAFTTRFVQGHAEPFLRLPPAEFRRLVAVLGHLKA